MSETLELMKAKKEATDLERLTYWKGWMPYLTSLGVAYVNGEPRRYYKHKHSPRYFYRRVAECELHRRR